jgi:hypothetical protein
MKFRLDVKKTIQEALISLYNYSLPTFYLTQVRDKKAYDLKSLLEGGKARENLRG